MTELQDLLEADAIDPLAHEYALARQLSHDIGNDDEGVSAPAARKAPLSLGLVLVVELLQGALANLGGDSARVQAGREPSHRTQDQAQVLQIGAYRGGDPRVLHLHSHRTAVVQAGTGEPSHPCPGRRTPSRPPK